MLCDWHCATFCQHLGDCHKISVFNSPVNPDKGLTPHTPQRRLRRLLFLCLLPGDPQAKQPGFTFRYKWPKLCYITKRTSSDDRLLNRHLWPDRLHRNRFRCRGLHPCPAFRSASREESKSSSKLNPLQNTLTGSTHEHSRSSRASCELRDRLLRSQYLQIESSASTVSFIKFHQVIATYKAFLGRDLQTNVA